MDTSQGSTGSNTIPYYGYTCSGCGFYVQSGAWHTCYHPGNTYIPAQPTSYYPYSNGPTYAQFNEILDKLRVIEEKLALISIEVHGGK